MGFRISAGFTDCAVLCVALAFSTTDSQAQTRAEGPWWPHQEWGPDDQSGASNRITPQKVLEAVALVRTGKVYELGHVYERSMPILGNRTYAISIPGMPTSGPFGPDLVSNDEFLATEIGQIGTQFDGPGHIGKRIRMSDDSTVDVYYNGFTSDEIQGTYGLRSLGVENVRPFITRGILIDVAGYKGVETLPSGYAVTLADVRGALAQQGIDEASIEVGDAIFFNFGWWRYWWDADRFADNWPGINGEVADWIVELQPSMVGSDSATDEAGEWAVHHELTLKRGIFNLEFMTFETLLDDDGYEFLFVFTPLRIKGATGSPARPLAIR